uniref:G8 domain-containing protein n=1 Tax=Amphora coffeiformis TaxID=265554 RepID=A0A7S3L0I4_9STRA|mmetsp:Transcript_4509/g.9424  ORF Transcript_4509/g.9424 Transcript_4509/m.9424 type:complete len:1115 (+) Transcript_4509:237-3581(+)
MNKKHYIFARRGALGLLIFSFVGIIWTLVAKKDSSEVSAHKAFDTLDQDVPTSSTPPVIPLPTDWMDYPPGPYIGADANTEMIILPTLPVPDSLNAPRTNCPWDDSTLVDWDPPTRPYQDATLPANARLIMRRAPSVELGILTIPETSELVLLDVPMELFVQGMVVAGTLTLGSESCPMLNKVVITLFGERPDNVRYQSVSPSYKGIHVPTGGDLQLHGKTYFPTWTRLARTVDPKRGDSPNVLFLQEEVNWEPGQQIVVITSAIKDSRDWHQNEIRTIESVYTASNHPEVAAVVTVTEPLEYRHVGHASYQTEVGLLTRNIVIQGAADDSEPSDPDPLNCTIDPGQLYYLGYDKTMGAPCPYTETTGYGGHILVEGEAQVEGVELVRMGQTNVQERYPFQFRMLGDNCPHCYIRRSSVHRSYYRGIVLEGTNVTTVTENVAYDVIGYCYMLKDGVEENNTISFNLGAHIHWLGPEPSGGVGRDIPTYVEEEKLAFPPDTSASAFFLPNAWNTVVGNVAVGGWAGFHSPNMKTPLNSFREWDWSPSTRPALLWDGNTAHSTAFWQKESSAFYVGGFIEYDNNGRIECGPGNASKRDTCETRKLSGDCKPYEFASFRITNTKVFLATVYVWYSHTGRFDIVGLEAHDTGSMQKQSDNRFWMDQILHVCRSGEQLELPDEFNTEEWTGSSMYFQTEGYKYIISNSIFRNCGVRDDKYNQYDNSPTRGCPADGSNTGCKAGSAVFYFTSFKDNLLPEINEATTNITYENCGRRFMSTYEEYETNMAMRECWIDADGSTSGLGEPTFIVSGTNRSKAWWRADDEAVLEPQRPLYFIKKNDGPKRSLAHVRMRWDDSVHLQDGQAYDERYCYQKALNCPEQGVLRHLGKFFTPDSSDYSTFGLPITPVGKVTGLSGGYGWLLEFNRYGAPKELTLDRMEIDPDSVLMVTIKYPRGTTFNIRANARICLESRGYICTEVFEQTDNIDDVRTFGNKYYIHSNGFLTLRLIQTSARFVGYDADGDGQGEWVIPGWDTPGKDQYEFALERFERAGVRLPQFPYDAKLTIEANCAGSGMYCSGDLASYDPDVCPSGYTQVGYDRCCRNGTKDCKYPDDGSLNFR